LAGVEDKPTSLEYAKILDDDFFPLTGVPRTVDEREMRGTVSPDLTPLDESSGPTAGVTGDGPIRVVDP